MSQVFAEFGNPKVEGNTGNFYIVLSSHQEVDQLTPSMTSKDEQRGWV